MREWESKGCAECRFAWESGKPLPKLGAHPTEPTILYWCPACGAYWEESLRYADVISEEEARQRYLHSVFPDTRPKEVQCRNNSSHL